MPDVIGPHFISPTTPSGSTYMEITGYALTPRTDTQGTHVVLRMRIQMGANSGLYTHPTDLAFGRKVVGTINRHSIGEHLIKRHALDRWELGGTYNYTLTFDIPYSPGTIYINISVVPEGAGNTNYMTTSTFTTGTNAYTVNSGYGAWPGIPTNILLGGKSVYEIGYVTSDQALALTWDAATPGTGAIQGYDIHWTNGNGIWNYKGNTAGLSYTIYPRDYSLARGGYIWFMVRSIGLYGVGPGATSPALNLVLAPSTPASVSISPASPPYSAELTLGWTLPAANDGMIDAVEVSVRHKPRGGTYTDWLVLTTLGAVVAYATTPSVYSAPYKAGPGSTYQYRIRVRTTFGVWSEYRESSEVLLKGGILRLKNSGVWKEGSTWIKVSGTWREAVGVYQRIAGVWKESA